MENDVDWEMAQICGEMMTNGLKIWKSDLNLGNGQNNWEMA